MTDVPRPAGYRPRSRRMHAAAGVFLALCGVLLVCLVLHQAAHERRFSAAGAAVGPAMVVFGAALAAFGGYREERLARGESLEGLEGLRLLTPRWWGVLALALALGALFTVALWRGWLPG